MTDTAAGTPDDPYAWLEDVTGDRALNWVRTRNAESEAELAGSPRFQALRDRTRAVLDADTRIPLPRRRGDHLYNFWRDAEHPRGLWRRTTLESYSTDAPEWDVIIDLDALADAEGENWVWGGTAVLREFDDDGSTRFPRALVQLSRGGADAVVVREYDLDARRFVPAAEGGFTVDEAKTDIGWIDRDSVYVGTDLGPGTLTGSGYPRQARRWTRGTRLADADVVYEGHAEDVAVGAGYIDTPGHERHTADRAIDFYTSERHLLTDSGEWRSLDVPGDAVIAMFRDLLVIVTRSDWVVGGNSYPAGTLLVAHLDSYVAGRRALTRLFAPDAHRSLEDFAFTRSALVLTILDDVTTTVEAMELGTWRPMTIDGLPEHSTLRVLGTDPDASDEIFLSATGFLQPPTLLHGTVADGVRTLKSAPAQFDAEGLAVRQHFAVSDDGTRVPYFVIGPESTQGPAPTLLYGYGGFENSLLPYYNAILGSGWLERGGTIVIANIRGGGEYGPTWHTSTLREGRHLVYEDFAAVARDLTARGITTPRRLGAQGGSNGGLLMGVMLTRYPELFGALVCQVPLLDMRRYHTLLAGASWMAEYGNPDEPADWEFMRPFSPYHNVDPQADYPPVILTTSTRDDRVHPGHARKMTALLREHGHRAMYYENIEGGHGGAADNSQQAYKSGLTLEFLWRTLADGDESE